MDLTKIMLMSQNNYFKNVQKQSKKRLFMYLLVLLSFNTHASSVTGTKTMNKEK